jgi:hypothetical protein
MSVWITDIVDSSTRHTLCVEVGTYLSERVLRAAQLPFLGSWDAARM